MQNNATDEQVAHVVEKIEGAGLRTHLSQGELTTVIGAIGDESKLMALPLERYEGVAKVMPVVKPYRLASREMRPEGSTFTIGNVQIGPGHWCLMAGPCTVESRDQLLQSARAAAAAGATVLRGGAFKPRTSPYDFQGLGEEGLKLLQEAGRETGLVTITEVRSVSQVPLVAKYVDIFQIGARNMQNYDLLQEVGQTRTPVVLKRGLSAKVNDLLMAAEYILAEGNERVILCERGIRTFEDQTRFTLDIAAVPVIKSLSHLPVIVDPSHAAGKAKYVGALARAAAAAGADGVIVEIHPNPEEALCDGNQALLPDQIAELAPQLEDLHRVAGRAPLLTGSDD
jgi:3-deoxy-7-phosphoheptulonate synthase